MSALDLVLAKIDEITGSAYQSHRQWEELKTLIRAMVDPEQEKLLAEEQENYQRCLDFIHSMHKKRMEFIPLRDKWPLDWNYSVGIIKDGKLDVVEEEKNSRKRRL